MKWSKTKSHFLEITFFSTFVFIELGSVANWNQHEFILESLGGKLHFLFSACISFIICRRYRSICFPLIFNLLAFHSSCLFSIWVGDFILLFCSSSIFQINIKYCPIRGNGWAKYQIGFCQSVTLTHENWKKNWKAKCYFYISNVILTVNFWHHMDDIALAESKWWNLTKRLNNRYQILNNIEICGWFRRGMATAISNISQIFRNMWLMQSPCSLYQI